MSEEIPYLLIGEDITVLWSVKSPLGCALNLSNGEILNAQKDTDIDAVIRSNVDLISTAISKLSNRRATKLLPV